VVVDALRAWSEWWILYLVVDKQYNLPSILPCFYPRMAMVRFERHPVEGDALMVRGSALDNKRVCHEAREVSMWDTPLRRPFVPVLEV